MTYHCDAGHTTISEPRDEIEERRVRGHYSDEEEAF